MYFHSLKIRKLFAPLNFILFILDDIFSSDLDKKNCYLPHIEINKLFYFILPHIERVKF